jgi:hypothetical protein
MYCLLRVLNSGGLPCCSTKGLLCFCGLEASNPIKHSAMVYIPDAVALNIQELCVLCTHFVQVFSLVLTVNSERALTSWLL